MTHLRLLVLFACSWGTGSLLAQEPAAPEAPPALTWKDLAARPELWPHRCKVTKDQKWDNGQAVAAGSELAVVELQGDFAVLAIAARQHSQFRPDDTDLLAIANAAYAALTPAQREIDAKTLAQRPDLWPAKVKTTGQLDEVGHKADTTIAAGSELDFGSFDGQYIRVRSPKVEFLRALRITETDFVERMRAALARPQAKGGHRVLRELEGKLVHATTGARKKVSASAPPEFVLLYFSAGWCPGCQEFSPKLVSFHKQQAAHAGKRFQTIWITRDKSEADMQRYAKQHDFPWLTVPWKELDKASITRAHAGSGIPELVLLDAKGAVVATTYDGDEYKEPERVLKALEERLGAGNGAGK